MKPIYQVILSLSLPLATQAALLSVNITNTDGPRQILAAESTGVIATTGWVNVQSNTPVTNAGSSGINITTFGSRGIVNTLRDTGTGDGTDGFLALYEAGLRDSTGGNQTDTGVTITGLSQFMTAVNATEYRIIAYYKLPVASGNRIFEIGVDTTFVTTNTPDYSNISASDSFVEHGNTDNNWMEFTGLTADSTTLYVNRGNRDALLTGFQIEAVPEPSSAGLLALAGLLTLARRKRA